MSKRALTPAIIAFLLLAPSTSKGETTGQTFSPVPSANPNVDNYMEFASWDHTDQWGCFNVHDPAITKVGDTYYMYSTDAIYFPPRKRGERRGKKPAEAAASKPGSRLNRKPGFAQMRKSKDLVNWEFIGWALPEIPLEAKEFVTSRNNGGGATNVWAPYMVDNGNGTYHLYFCVSAFGKNTSVIGLATAASPEGPWEYKGAVVETDHTTPMNAIDPSVITANGRRFMHYGSYFSGLYCVEINPETGFTMKQGDRGHIIARRDHQRRDNIEAPEIIFNPQNGNYYLFASYDPLMTTYNVRVCRSEKPEGPFLDFNGKDMAEPTNNYPLLTAPYRFENHDGWVGTAHCGVIADGEGNYFMAHQGRLASEPNMMVLHLRQMFFTPEGWPVVSPERYNATPQKHFSKHDLAGKWEIMRLREPAKDQYTQAEEAEILKGRKPEDDINLSFVCSLNADGSLEHSSEQKGNAPTTPSDWIFNETEQMLTLSVNGEKLKNLITFAGHDWEREQDTVLFTGLDSNGRAVWGKRIE